MALLYQRNLSLLIIRFSKLNHNYPLKLSTENANATDPQVNHPNHDSAISIFVYGGAEDSSKDDEQNWIMLRRIDRGARFYLEEWRGVRSSPVRTESWLNANVY